VYQIKTSLILLKKKIK